MYANIKTFKYMNNELLSYKNEDDKIIIKGINIIFNLSLYNF